MSCQALLHTLDTTLTQTQVRFGAQRRHLALQTATAVIAALLLPSLGPALPLTLVLSAGLLILAAWQGRQWVALAQAQAQFLSQLRGLRMNVEALMASQAHTQALLQDLSLLQARAHRLTTGSPPAPV